MDKKSIWYIGQYHLAHIKYHIIFCQCLSLSQRLGKLFNSKCVLGVCTPAFFKAFFGFQPAWLIRTQSGTDLIYTGD